MFCATAKSGLFSQFSTRSLRSPNQKSKHREKFWKPSHFIQPSTVTSSRFVNASAGSSTKLFVPSSWRTWFVTDWEPGAASWAKHGSSNSTASVTRQHRARVVLIALASDVFPNAVSRHRADHVQHFGRAGRALLDNALDTAV